MKQFYLILFLISQFLSFSQQISSKKFTTTSSIEIDTNGLDEIVLETSNDNFISIFLDEENPFTHHIITFEEHGFLKISFQSEAVQKDEVFRKFITKRLNRASVKIKIPKGKQITFLGKEIDIISKNYQGDLSVFIDKGMLNFNTIKGDINAQLLQGIVFAEISKLKRIQVL